MALPLPTVEVVFAPATERFRADPRDLALVQPTFDILDNATGEIR